MEATSDKRMHGPIGRVVFAHLDDLNHFLDERDITNARVFGSVARGDDTEASDLDLLIDVPPGTSLFELVRWQDELAELLGVRVDLGTDVKTRIRERVEAEAIPVGDLAKYRSETAVDPSRANLS